MSLRLALVAAVVFAGSTVAACALPIDQFTLPSNDATTQKKDSTDGLFNHSVPDRWDNTNTASHSDGDDLGNIHFSAHSSQNFGPSSNYGDAKQPMSEFYGPTPPQNDNTDPLFNH